MSNIHYKREVPLTLMGEITPRVVIYKSESHKLHQAFVPKLEKPEGTDRVKIFQGQPVALTTDGEIEPYTGADDQVYLGIAATDSINPAYPAKRNYPIEVTVMVEAYAICNYISDGKIDCGYVKPTGNTIQDHFIEVTASTDETKFIAIDPADEAGEIVQVLIR